MNDAGSFFKNRVAVVTGGMGGLGTHIVERFLSEGMKIGIPVRSGSTPQAVPAAWENASDRVFIEKADLTQDSDVIRFLSNCSSRLGPTEILINTVGGYAGGERIGEAPMKEFDDMINMNLRPTILMSSNVLHGMREGKFGRIVSIAAKPAVHSPANRGPYAIAKRAVVTLTETIAEEVAGSGITANAIAPSIILTDANRTSMPGADTGKWVTPQEIAELVLFLCSWQARSINGNVIKIYGGV
jgi:NAD(P)-dependent dehydrogenase (short-subunit alcohol dehydrogenase family)